MKLRKYLGTGASLFLAGMSWGYMQAAMERARNVQSKDVRRIWVDSARYHHREYRRHMRSAT